LPAIKSNRVKSTILTMLAAGIQVTNPETICEKLSFHGLIRLCGLKGYSPGGKNGMFFIAAKRKLKQTGNLTTEHIQIVLSGGAFLTQRKP
jgi:hypothetical protein